MPVILIITGCVLLAEYAGGFQQYEAAGLDAILRGKTEQFSKKIFIVEITDADYREKFHSHSPLDRGTLGTLVQNLCSANPAVLVVDIETERTGIPACEQVAWVTPVETPAPMGSASFFNWFLGRESDIELRAKPGFHQFADKAVSVFPVDRDGVVRRYRRSFKLEGDGDAPLISRVAAKVAAKKEKRDVESGEHETIIFNFAAGRYRFPIIESRQFLDGNPQTGSKILAGATVLIGGNFSEARDRYRTPLGEMAGVELIAHAIDSELNALGVAEVPPYRGMLMDIAAGSLIAFLFWRLYVKPAFYTSLVGIPLAAMLFSALLFRHLHYWLTFVPVIVGMVIHQLYDLAKHASTADELEDKIEEMEREIANLRPAGRSEAVHRGDAARDDAAAEPGS